MQQEYREREGLTERGYPYDQSLTRADPVSFTMENEDCTITHLRNFFSCMRSRKTPIEDIEVGHYAATVAHMANISNNKKSLVTWDKENKTVNE